MTEEDVPSLMINADDFAGMTKLQAAEKLTRIAVKVSIPDLLEFLDVSGMVETPENAKDLKEYLMEIYVVRQLATLEAVEKISIPEL